MVFSNTVKQILMFTPEFGWDPCDPSKQNLMSFMFFLKGVDDDHHLAGVVYSKVRTGGSSNNKAHLFNPVAMKIHHPSSPSGMSVIAAEVIRIR